MAALQEQCGSDAAHAMDELRDSVAQASQAFVQALDHAVVGAANNDSSSLMRDIHAGKSYPTVSSLISKANHLEHFHVYSKTANDDSTHDDETAASLDWHTDAGLFLAFVPAMICGDSTTTENDDKAFYFKDAQGYTTRAIFDNDSIVFMLGAGAQHWLTSTKQFKATQHAVQMKAGTERAWYGMSTFYYSIIADSCCIVVVQKHKLISHISIHSIIRQCTWFLKVPLSNHLLTAPLVT
jgi:hypothetical protein